MIFSNCFSVFLYVCCVIRFCVRLKCVLRLVGFVVMCVLSVLVGGRLVVVLSVLKWVLIVW